MALIPVVFVLQYVAVSNWAAYYGIMQDTGAWMTGSYFPLFRVPEPIQGAFKVVQPILIQPLASMIGPTLKAGWATGRVPDTLVGNWVAGGATGSLQDQRRWDLQFAALNTFLWALIIYLVVLVIRVWAELRRRKRLGRPQGPGEEAIHRGWTSFAVAVGHFCLQVLLCAAFWTAYALRPSGLGLGFVCLGCAALGVVSSLCRRGCFEASAAVLLVSMASLTESYRVTVLDYVGGQPTFWIAFKETATINAPYATVLALLALAGWHGTRAIQRRHRPADGGA